MSSSSTRTDGSVSSSADPLDLFEEPTRRWFKGAFEKPTLARKMACPAIGANESSTDLCSGRLGKNADRFPLLHRRPMFEKERAEGCSVIYISPLEALAVAGVQRTGARNARSDQL